MPEAKHFSASAEPKGNYALPAEFDGRVSTGAMYHAVRAVRNNQRQGTASTKTRGEVSGGNQKPWRQKGTGRARQGSTRAPNWVGGGIVFGPRPRKYTTPLNRKVKRLARRSAFNQRAAEGAIAVIESLDFATPKTKDFVALLERLGVLGSPVLVLTAEHRPNVYLSGRNIPGVRVLKYADATALDVLWGRSIVIEEGALGGHHVAGSEAAKAARKTAKKASRKVAKPVAKKKVTKKVTKKATKGAAKTTKKKKGGADA